MWGAERHGEPGVDGEKGVTASRKRRDAFLQSAVFLAQLVQARQQRRNIEVLGLFHEELTASLAAAPETVGGWPTPPPLGVAAPTPGAVLVRPRVVVLLARDCRLPGSAGSTSGAVGRPSSLAGHPVAGT